MKIIISFQRNNVTIEQERKIITIYPFDLAVNKISANEFESKGDLLVGTGAGEFRVMPAGSDGYVLTARSTEADGVAWEPITGGAGGEASLTNKSGGSVVAGDVVMWDDDNDEAFKTTTLEQDRRICGVSKEGIANNGTGKIAIGYSVVTVNVTGNVARGEWLITSTTAKTAKANGFIRPLGAIGMALTAYAGGGSGTVKAIILPDIYSMNADGTYYSCGGNNTAAVGQSEIIKFVGASETFSTLGATLAAGKQGMQAIYNEGVSTHGYVVMGSTSAGYVTTIEKLTYASEVISGPGNANYNNRWGGWASNGTYGYSIAGSDGTNRSEVDRFTFATDAAATSTAITGARQAPCDGAWNAGGSNGYVFGGTDGAYLNSIPKVNLTTGATSAATGTLADTLGYGFAGFISSVAAFVIGGYDGAIKNAIAKLLYSSEAVSAGSATLATAKSSGASFNYGILQVAYAAAGSTSAASSGSISTVEKYNMASDAMSAAANAYPAARAWSRAIGAFY